MAIYRSLPSEPSTPLTSIRNRTIRWTPSNTDTPFSAQSGYESSFVTSSASPFLSALLSTGDSFARFGSTNDRVQRQIDRPKRRPATSTCLRDLPQDRKIHFVSWLPPTLSPCVYLIQDLPIRCVLIIIFATTVVQENGFVIRANKMNEERSMDLCSRHMKCRVH